MSEDFQPKKTGYCIVINSTVYFLIAYYFVVFSHNILSMVLAKSLGYDVELFYYGFTHTGKEWTISDVLYVFFYGNILSLVLAVVAERLYRSERRFSRGIKLLYLWTYIISLVWFLGNIIVGAFFNFGIGAALRAYKTPFFLKMIMAMAAVYLLLFLGKRTQKHVRVSANLFFAKLLRRETINYFIRLILLPTLFGLVIIILMKIPYLALYRFIDLYLLFTVVFFLIGMLYRAGSNDAISFRTFKPDEANRQKSCNIYYVPLIILILILGGIRIGLMNGVAF